MKQKIASALKWSQRYTKTDMTYLASGAFWGNLNMIIYSLFGLIATMLFARFLTKESYGMYQYILSIAGLIGATTLTGMNSAVTRAVARGHEGELRNAIRYQILFGSVAFACSLAVSGWYFIHSNNALAVSFLFVAIFLPLGNAYNTWAAYTGGKKLFRIGTYYGLLNTTIAYGGIIAFVYFSRNFVWVAFANFFFIFIGNFIVYTLVTRHMPPNKEMDPETLPYGKHLSAMAIPGMIAAQVDAFLVYQFIGPASLAVYTFATLLPEKLSGSMKFISNIALPKFSAISEEEVRRSIAKKIMWLVGIAAIASAAYALAAPLIFRLLFPTYGESVIFTQVYALSIFSVISNFLQTALTSQKKTRELYIFNFTVPFIKIALLAILMYYWSVWGIVWAQIITIFLSIAILFFLLMKRPITTRDLLQTDQ